jgi:hypothetical protein
LLGREEIIRQAILRSGFPLQMEISAILSKRDYEVFNSAYFFDPDEKKTREFDIEAFLSPTKYGADELIEKGEWYLNPSVLIECKKSDECDWVFFDSKPIEGHLDIGHSLDVLTKEKGYMNSVCGHLMTEGFSTHFTSSDYVTGAYQQVRANGSIERKKNEILDALSKITKFINYEFEKLSKFFAKDSGRNDVIFFYPIVVFAGDLYFASFKNTLEIEKVPYLIYETKYLSTLTGDLVPLYVDIVEKDALPELLSIIEKEINDLHRYLSKSEIQEKLNSLIH